ncbi:MAG: hypothetical protein H5T43_03300 [Methanomethylovorans sp.]|jgi:UPF0148 protein|nr:hypothetical protein [Methanomethylovorans sp.]
MSQKDEESITKISRMLEIGGTMLAQHCSECGAPLFRYKGNVICPVCDTGNKYCIKPAEKHLDKQEDYSSELSAGINSKIQVPSSVNVISSSDNKFSEVDERNFINSEVLVQNKAVSGESLQCLEEILTTKIIMLARSMQQEQDLSRINEFLKLIEKSLDIIDKLKK